MIAGVGSGILRSLRVNRPCVADLVPVDDVASLLCAAAVERARSFPGRAGLAGITTGRAGHAGITTVYHATSGAPNPITWGEIEDSMLPIIREFPPEKLLWYPGGTFKGSCSDGGGHGILSKLSGRVKQ